MPVRLKIRELRDRKERTQRYMADLLGTTETNYRRLESNKLKSISFEAIEKLCLEFQCTPNDLIEVYND